MPWTRQSVLHEVLHDIVDAGRWAPNAQDEVFVETVEAHDTRRVVLDQMHKVARKGVKCRHLGGDKRAPRCLHEEDCDNGNPCMLPRFES